MATRIDHGPPGSYKSFSLVQRFAVPALADGRVVVTNIRGFDSVDSVIAAYPDLEFPPSARIIFVDTTTQKGRLKMACWFHWIPFGACVLIDEVQQIYPDRRDFKLESLDKYEPIPDDVIEDIGLPEGRPEDVFTAYDKQRHYNWDIFLTTPNIAKVKPEIRQVTEYAYRHRDISGILPWAKNEWIETQHDPENNGKSKAHVIGTPTRYKADPRAFACYKSTATGQHIESGAGRSIFADTKLRAMGVVILVCFSYLGYYFFGGQSASKPDASSVAPSSVPSSSPSNANPVYDAVVSTPSPAVNGVPALTPISITKKLIMSWSLFGVEKADLLRLVAPCSVTTKSVSCSSKFLRLDDPILQASTNHYCERVSGIFNCTMLFFFKPEKKQEYNTSPTLLASSVTQNLGH